MLPSVFDALKAFVTERNLVNVAEHCPAQQSSHSAWSKPDDASGAVSGALPDDFAFHTDIEPDPWWEVDLQWEYPLEIIVLHNRRAAARERAHHIEVSVSSDRTTWMDLHKGYAAFGASGDGLPFILPLSGSLTVRYVRLKLPGTTYFHLSQVEAYAKERDFRLSRFVRGLEAARPDDLDVRIVQIGILGTSNSLMTGGYTASLRMDPRFSIECNLSLGSSHPTMVPYRIVDEELAKCDAVVFDLGINEQAALYEGAYDVATAKLVFEHIIQVAARLDFVPVFLLMPEGMSYAKSNAMSFKVRRTYLDLCQKYAVPYFDGYCLAEAMAELASHDVRSFFADPRHIDKRCARLLGDQLGEALFTALPMLRSRRGEAEVSRLGYIPMSVAGSHSLASRQRTTSIVSAEVIEMRPGAIVELPLPPGAAVVGLVFNMRKSNAALRIEGRTTTTKNLNSLYLDPGPSIWLVSWSLLQPVEADAGGVRLQCVSNPDLATMEANDHGNCPHATDEPCVELAGVIVAHPPAKVSTASFTGCEIDLWQHVAHRFAPPAAPATNAGSPPQVAPPPAHWRRRVSLALGLGSRR